MQSVGLLGRHLEPKTWFYFNGKLSKPLVEIVLIPLRLTAAAPAAKAGKPKLISRSGMTTLITSNEETDDFMKIVKSLEKTGLLIKGASKTIKNEAKG